MNKSYSPVIEGKKVTLPTYPGGCFFFLKGKWTHASEVFDWLTLTDMPRHTSASSERVIFTFRDEIDMKLFMIAFDIEGPSDPKV